MTVFYRLSQFCFRSFFQIFYRHQVIFPEGVLYPEAAIIAPNHVSFFDPPLMAASWPNDVHFFARKSLFKNPLLNLLISGLNAHPVGSGNDLTSIKLACKLLEEGKKILIFPEGTRSDDGSLIPFKRGVGMLALRAKVAIIPTYIHGTFEVWPKGKRFPHLFFRGKTACIFGKPIFPDELHLTTPDAVAARVREEIDKLKQNYLHHLSKIK
ncbi:MAG: plsC [Chlamydiia bacterium]|nr:plsC [Chlamydiia bacterium]